MALRFISLQRRPPMAEQSDVAKSPHHLTPPCQQCRLCAEAHQGIVGKPAGVSQHTKKANLYF